jgi:hypothetical protein
MAFVYLGSDGVIKFRRPAGTGERVKQGQIFVQAGDVVGVQTGADGLDVIAHQDGFGFGKFPLSLRQNQLIFSMYLPPDLPTRSRSSRNRQHPDRLCRQGESRSTPPNTQSTTP